LHCGRLRAFQCRFWKWAEDGAVSAVEEKNMADASLHDQALQEKSTQPLNQKQDRMEVERVRKEKKMTKEKEEEEKTVEEEEKKEEEEEEEKTEEEEESEEESEEPSVVCKCGTLAKKGKRVKNEDMDW
jgi:hypothetical protein